jgi:hypothetical protein
MELLCLIDVSAVRFSRLIVEFCCSSVLQVAPFPDELEAEQEAVRRKAVVADGEPADGDGDGAKTPRGSKKKKAK